MQRFYDLSALEVKELDFALDAKKREKESIAENHSIEVRVYQQKIKHLMFEHQGVDSAMATAKESEASEEAQAHLVREALLRAGKGDLKERIKSMEESNAEAIRTLKVQQEKGLARQKEDFRLMLEKLRAKYDGRLETLKADLGLRHKVAVHEVEERNNLHICQLSTAHEDAFAEMRRYYNDITRGNLELITQLKSSIAVANSKAATNQTLVLEIAEENKKLSEPLQQALSERAKLLAELKDAARDKASLAYARTRLGELRTNLASLQSSQTDLEARYAATSAERDDLYNKFEATVRALAEKAEVRSSALEQRIAGAENEHAAAHMAASHLVEAAQLDPIVLAEAGARVEGAVNEKNAALRELQGAVARLRKAHDDAIRTLSVKLVDLGMDPKEAREGVSLLDPYTGFPGPSGLIVQSSAY